jgi:uncharacterized membrane protein (UPF0127 family)
VNAAPPTTPHFLADVLKRGGCYGLLIERSGVWLARTVEAAVDSETRKRGLLGRDALDPNSAIVIAPSQGVHTFGMRFNIDIVGVGRDGRVIKIREAVPPRRLVFSLRAFAIVEMAAGACTRMGLRVGDRLVADRTDCLPRTPTR